MYAFLPLGVLLAVPEWRGYVRALLRESCGANRPGGSDHHRYDAAHAVVALALCVA